MRRRRSNLIFLLLLLPLDLLDQFLLARQIELVLGGEELFVFLEHGILDHGFVLVRAEVIWCLLQDAAAWIPPGFNLTGAGLRALRNDGLREG